MNVHRIFQSKFLVFFLLLATIVLRLYRFEAPIADWHSWRQVDTSAVSRSFVEEGFDILHPKFHDLSNVPSGKDNLNGYRFVEFPIFNLLQAGGYVLFNTFTLEQWGRIITIISSTLTTLFIYLIVKRHADAVSGFFAALFFAILPYNIFYGRVILPDPSMVMAITGGIYFFDLAIEKKIKYDISHIKLFIAFLFTSAAFLLKPYAIFFTLPMLVLAWQKFGVEMFRKWQLWVFAAACVVPLAWWRQWMTAYPEGIPANDWLLNGGDIRFKGAYFYWIYGDRIARLILGFWGIALFILGVLFNSQRKELRSNGVFFYSFLISSFLYITIFARGNVQHDYYQILIIPSLVIFMGLGAKMLLLPPKELIHQWVSRTLLVCCIFLCVGLGWYFVRDYFNINNANILIAGNAVDKLTPKDARVIAPYDGDTTFLYYTKRKGWASFQKSLPEMKELGADYLIIVNPKQEDYGIAKEFSLVSSAKEYLLFKLE